MSRPEFNIEGDPSALVENPVTDLLHAEIDSSQIVLGTGPGWLERGSVAVIIGPSGVGKSMVAMQVAIEASLGREVFGIPCPQRLRVCVVQSEDSKNRRILQSRCIATIGTTPALVETIGANVRIVTTYRRGSELFYWLGKRCEGLEVDLFIFNPAFAFFPAGKSVNDSTAVGSFLRAELSPFLSSMRAAGIVIHHVPKPAKDGAAARSISTTMYSGAGSAEWANAPRASITIDSTNAQTVFAFTAGKSGKETGWAPSLTSRGVAYLRYFAWSLKPPMMWLAASAGDVASAKQATGLSDGNLLDLFTNDSPERSYNEIYKALEGKDFVFSDHELDEMLQRMVAEGRLVMIARENDEMVYTTPKAAKRKKAAASHTDNVGLIFSLIRDAMPAGIRKTAIREAVPFGNNESDKCISELLAADRIYYVDEGSRATRYFVREKLALPPREGA